MPLDGAWTCQDLVDHASNWSLAGNVGLLKHMEQFADNLFKKADETDRKLNNLMNGLDATSVQLDLVKNQFLGLQNTQFIESRVYEDDELTEIENHTQKTHLEDRSAKQINDENKRKMMKQAVLDGFQVLDECYDRVCIPKAESDSEESGEDELDKVDYMLRPKNSYSHRPLPFIIGTKEWHSKWHAGLLDSSDDEDEAKLNGTSKIMDEFSDTDSEQNLPVDDRISVQDEVNGTIHNDFAAQLSSKLGKIGLNADEDPEINTRPIQKRVLTSGKDLLFSVDQTVPPSIESRKLDENDDFRQPKGLFSGSGGLFDDVDDDDVPVGPPPVNSNEKDPQIMKIRDLFDSDPNDFFDEPEIDPPPVKPPPISAQMKTRRGLFDETDDEDDFLPPPVPKIASSAFPLPQNDIKHSSPPDSMPTHVSKPEIERKEKVLSLFDDTDDFFEDDLFSDSSKTDIYRRNNEETKGNSIIDAENPPPIPSAHKSEEKNKYFFDSSSSIDEKPRTKVRNLFDESDDDDENDLFRKDPPLPEHLATEKISKTLLNIAKLHEAEANLHDEPKKLPGKLKHNLNINVDALIPGARPAKPKLLENEEIEKISDDFLPPQAGASNILDDAAKKEEIIDEISPQMSFDSVNVLKSVTKDRVKINVKRRPSTRRGRKAALLTSGLLDFPENSPENPEKEQNDFSSDCKSEIAPISFNTNKIDELDEDTCLPSSSPSVSKEKEAKDSLSGHFSVFSKSTKATNEVSVIADLDDELILDVESSKIQENEPPLITKRFSFDTKKVSLFDDFGNDSDEDLFAPTHQSSRDVSNVRVFDTIPAKSQAKSEHKDIFDDFDIEIIKKHDKNDVLLKEQDVFSSDAHSLQFTPEIKKKSLTEKLQASLFDDDGDDDDFERILFGGTSKIGQEPKDSNITSMGRELEKKKKEIVGKMKSSMSHSLFGDDDDDDDEDTDDLFGSSNKSKSSKIVKPMSVKPSSFVTSSHRTKATSGDPLAALFGDDNE